MPNQFNPFGAVKLLAFPDRIHEWMTTGTTWPINVEFDMTNVCNHNCPGCAGGRQDDKAARWDYDGALSALREFYEGGTLSVKFSGGGEPLMNPATVPIITAVTDWGMSAGLITNAGVMADDWIPLLTTRCTWIRVSLDAATQDSYEKIHGTWALLETTITNLTNLATAPGRTAVVGVGYLTSQQTQSEMMGAAQIAKAAGADYIQFHPYNGDTHNVLPEVERVRVGLESDSFRVLASTTKYVRMGSSRTYTTCHAQHFLTVVAANGNLFRCCDLKNADSETPLGNIRTHSLREILASEQRCSILTRPVSACPELCRNNAINELLQSCFVIRPTHAEFL